MLTTMDRQQYYEAIILGREEAPLQKRVVAGPYRIEAEDVETAERLAATAHGKAFSRIDGIELTQVEQAEFITSGRDKRIRESRTVIVRRTMRLVPLEVAEEYLAQITESPAGEARTLCALGSGRP